ncbi:hypothetical protein SS37_19280 [Enterobacter sichuanensis]|uniref:Uncharacterized protein n=1 Tax=Enterobacter sichuanensis TaxID=2071710 RepID=A0A0F1AM64_9ENTR|nr:hypothetical protein SS37_19280 [Enterobacter sichuanensis]
MPQQKIEKNSNHAQPFTHGKFSRFAYLKIHVISKHRVVSDSEYVRVMPLTIYHGNHIDINK